MGQVTITYNCGTGDCYGSTGAGIFNNSNTFVAVSTDSDGANEHLRSWFPFAGITLKKGVSIISAILYVTASTTSGVNNTNVILGCEAADNPSNPTNETDLLGRTRTTAILGATLGQFINGTTYSFDITSSVQEVINRSGWSYGNTLAAIIDSDDTTPRKRLVYSADNGSNMAQLIIVANVFTPALIFSN